MKVSKFHLVVRLRNKHVPFSCSYQVAFSDAALERKKILWIVILLFMKLRKHQTPRLFYNEGSQRPFFYPNEFIYILVYPSVSSFIYRTISTLQSYYFINLLCHLLLHLLFSSFLPPFKFRPFPTLIPLNSITCSHFSLFPGCQLFVSHPTHNLKNGVPYCTRSLPQGPCV